NIEEGLIASFFAAASLICTSFSSFRNVQIVLPSLITSWPSISSLYLFSFMVIFPAWFSFVFSFSLSITSLKEADNVLYDLYFALTALRTSSALGSVCENAVLKTTKNNTGKKIFF